MGDILCGCDIERQLPVSLRAEGVAISLGMLSLLQLARWILLRDCFVAVAPRNDRKGRVSLIYWTSTKHCYQEIKGVLLNKRPFSFNNGKTY